MSINLTSQFHEHAALPLEVKMVAADITARDAIDATERYDGLQTYVISTNENWQLQGGVTNADWVNVTGGSTAVGIIGATSGIVSNPTPGITTETWLGDQAGANGGSTNSTVFIGISAGDGATNADNSIFIGDNAGLLDTVNNSSNNATIYYGSLSGGTFSASDAITSTSGGTATVVSDDGTMSMVVSGVSGIFLVGDTIDNGLGVTAVVSTFTIINSILIGNNTSTGGFSNSIAIGDGVVNTASGQFLANKYKNVFIGQSGLSSNNTSTGYLDINGSVRHSVLSSGDGTGNYSLVLDLDSDNGKASIYNSRNGDRFLVADRGSNTYNFGGIDNVNITYLHIDDSMTTAEFFAGGGIRMMSLSRFANLYQLGDIDGAFNGTGFEINDTTQITQLYGKYNTVSHSNFFQADFSNGLVHMGDLDGSGNSTVVIVDDVQQTVFLGSTGLTFWQIDSANVDWTGMLGGNASMLVNTTDGNTFLGFATAGSLTTGNKNSVYGALAGGNTADGVENTFNGYSAGNANVAGSFNVYEGSFAGSNNEGSNNTFVGRRAGLGSTAASDMVAIGAGTGLTNDGNGNSIFIGVGADGTSSSVDGGIALGNGALTSKRMMVVGSDTMPMNFFYIGNGISAVTPVQSVLFGLTDYIDATSTDGNGSAMILHYGNNTGNGLQGEYQFQGSAYNIGDVSGDLINADITFQKKSGSQYSTSNATVQTLMFIKFQGDGGFQVVWHIEAVDLTNGDSADWIIENAVNVVAGIATTTGFDVITYGTTSGASTWTCESKTDGANGYGLKLAGEAGTDVIWTVRWDITTF